MRTLIGALAILAVAGCDDDDDDWLNGDPELRVTNKGGYTVRVEVEDLDDDVFYVEPGTTRDWDLRSYHVEVRIVRTVDGLELYDDDLDGDDFHHDRVEITVTP